jgi:tRNA A58 N-methylase Trm61
MAYLLKSARFLAAQCHCQLLNPGDRVIDATMGNGQDTCTLARLVGDDGKVIAFDVQEAAVERTRALLLKEGLLLRCELHQTGHEHVLQVVKEPVKLAAFNLGWLPGGDKSVTTRWETTRKAMEGCLQLLLPGGVCTVCAYPGHEEGNRELQELKAFLASLPPQMFNVLHQQFINAGPGSPECFILQRQ